MTTLLMDAFEARDVATANIAGAYLFVDIDEYIKIRLTGDSVKIIYGTDSLYVDYIYNKKGRAVLYLQLIKALYDCIRSALLWYEFAKNQLAWVSSSTHTTHA